MPSIRDIIAVRKRMSTMLFPAKFSTTSDSTWPTPVSEIEPTMMPARPVAIAIVVMLLAAVTIAQNISAKPMIKSSLPISSP